MGIPGAKNFKTEYSKYFEKFKNIYIQNENDEGAKQFVQGIVKNLPVDKLYTITPKELDSECKDVSDLHIAGKLDVKKLLYTAKPLAQSSIDLRKDEDPHVIIGKKLISMLKLRYYNARLYSYTEQGVYREADDTYLKNCIVRKIEVNAKKHTCNEVIEFVNNWLANSSNITVDDNYINFRNGLFSIKDNMLLPHTEDVFTINQVAINYIEDDKLEPNELVDNYIKTLMSDNPKRITTLFQNVGYCLTARTDTQQAIIWYRTNCFKWKIHIW